MKNTTDLVKASFYITYIFLMTTGTITFIEALRTPNPVVRHIMNLETCISIVAAYFYSIFISQIDKRKDIPYSEIIITRYTDWMITTPIMLFVLCMVLANQKKINFTIATFLIVILLDFGMLIFGYLGEAGYMNKMLALFISFAFFFALFFYIWYTFLREGKNNFIVSISFYIFLVIWSIYGLIYMANDMIRNIIYNVLDLIAKSIIGLFFWMYFTKSVVF